MFPGAAEAFSPSTSAFLLRKDTLTCTRAHTLDLREPGTPPCRELRKPGQNSAKAVARLHLGAGRGLDRAPDPGAGLREHNVLHPTPGDQDLPSRGEQVLPRLDLVDDLVREGDALPIEQPVTRVRHHAFVQFPDGRELILRDSYVPDHPTRNPG